MNNIAGFIQPSVFAQPNVVGLMPQSMPIIATGGRSDILTIVLVSGIVVVILFIAYRNMSSSNIKEEEEDIEEFKKVRERFENTENMDPLTKCGWEVYVSPTCPYCVRQKQILEHHFPTFKNIFTDKPAEVVPTWYNTKTHAKVLGMQTYDKLLSMAKC